METLEKGIVTLCKAAITGQRLALPEGFELSSALPQLRRHGILTLAYEGALLCGIKNNTPVMREMFPEYCRVYMHSEGQLRELDRVLSLLEEQGLDYMPLKGCRLKSMYPKPELRPMGDADLLVRDGAGGFDTKAMAELFRSMGYTVKADADYVLELEHPALYLELHKSLFTNELNDFRGYFESGWSAAVRENGHSHRMKAEDEYVYLFAHFTKHYRYSGIGIRHVLDLWVYRHTAPGMDWDYINSCLEKLDLSRFHNNICRLIAFWFEDGPGDDMAEYLSSFIFSSGSWGRLEIKVITSMLHESGEEQAATKTRMSYFLSRLFLPLRKMKNIYPLLHRLPWLLPLFWIIRPIDKLLFDRKAVLRKTRVITAAGSDALDARARELEYVGLNTDY